MIESFDWVAFLSQIGFPIVISIYLLIRMEKRINYLTDSIIKLTQIIELIKYDRTQDLNR